MAKIERQAWLCAYDGGKPALFNYDPSDTDSGLYRVLSGPITVTFDVPNACPHCGGALPEAQDKAEPPKELVIEAGGRYRTRNCGNALVEKVNVDYTYAADGRIGSKPASWTLTGAWYIGEESDEDLVERLS